MGKQIILLLIGKLSTCILIETINNQQFKYNQNNKIKIVRCPGSFYFEGSVSKGCQGDPIIKHTLSIYLSERLLQGSVSAAERVHFFTRPSIMCCCCTYFGQMHNPTLNKKNSRTLLLPPPPCSRSLNIFDNFYSGYI